MSNEQYFPRLIVIAGIIKNPFGDLFIWQHEYIVEDLGEIKASIDSFRNDAEKDNWSVYKMVITEIPRDVCVPVKVSA